MKSPFPGMDPYIEACGLWGDFHHSLIYKVADRLAETIPERYHVRTGERSYLVLIGAEGRKVYSFLPDVAFTTPRSSQKSSGSSAVAEPKEKIEPLTMRAFVREQFRETFVEIYESSPEQRLVTCIEALSPSNKRPNTKGWKRYLRKRQSLLMGKINLVEFDLLRGGERMPMLDPWPGSPYTLLVHRGTGTQLCRVWPAHYRQPLPGIRVPLARPDEDVTLEIQPLIDTIYERFRYARSIDYRKPLAPPLDREDAAWLKQRLKERKSGRR